MLTEMEILEANLANQQTVKIGQGKRTMTIQELALNVKQIKEGALDFVVNTETLRAQVKYPQPADVDKVLTLEIQHENGRGLQGYELTNWAHRQLADKCGIPQKYYDKLRAAKKIELLAENVNAWIRLKEKRRIRTVNGVIRAIVSDKFLPISNHIVADEFLKAIVEFGLDPAKDVQACSITDTHMHIRATVPHLEAEIRKGDVLVQGLMITNSEVGASSFKVEPFLLRLVCSNGLIAPRALTRIHLGSRADIGEYQFSDEVQDAELDLITKQVRDIIRSTFDQKLFDQWIAEIKGTTEVKIPDVVVATDRLAERYNLKHKQDSIINALATSGDPTQYGLVNAVTMVAKDIPTFEGQIDLERAAGEISVMTPEQFEKAFTVKVER